MPTEPETFTLTADQLLAVYASAQVSGIASFLAGEGMPLADAQQTGYAFGGRLHARLTKDPAIREELLAGVRAMGTDKPVRFRAWM